MARVKTRAMTRAMTMVASRCGNSLGGAHMWLRPAAEGRGERSGIVSGRVGGGRKSLLISSRGLLLSSRDFEEKLVDMPPASRRVAADAR